MQYHKMSTKVTVALAQHLNDCDPLSIVSEAKGKGADIGVFPEMFSNGHANFDARDPNSQGCWQRAAEPVDGSYVAKFRRAAQKSELYVVATLLEAAEPKPFNSALLINPQGETVLHHRKVHICDFDTPEVACARGHEFRTMEIHTAAGPVTVGIMICMDREFPDAARSLSQAGAEIALVPNCCTLTTDRNQSDVRVSQMRGRAFEMVMGIACR
jgi:deaminated glutathione amidase